MLFSYVLRSTTHDLSLATLLLFLFLNVESGGYTQNKGRLRVVLCSPFSLCLSLKWLPYKYNENVVLSLSLSISLQRKSFADTFSSSICAILFCGKATRSLFWIFGVSAELHCCALILHFTPYIVVYLHLKILVICVKWILLTRIDNAFCVRVSHTNTLKPYT